MKKKEGIELSKALSITKKFKEGVSQKSSSYEMGKIILLCGTSTAGKTSICNAAQTEASKTGHAWIVDGADLAEEKLWTEPSELNGTKYLSAQDHYVNAMKTYVDPSSIVDSAVSVFGARTLAIALLSRRYLGNLKVDQIDLTPEKDIKVQAEKIYNLLSPENKKQYAPDSIEHLLKIIQDCPESKIFREKHPYPPKEQLNELMLERAITRARNGESTILDLIGNEETINGERLVDIFHLKLNNAELPEGAGAVAMVHCPINTLIDRIDYRNEKALSENRQEDVRLSFFPFEQYGVLYEKAPKLLESGKPVVGEISRQDIIIAAHKFGRGEENATELLNKLGFTDNEESVLVTPKIQSDVIFQSEKLSSEQIAQQLCEIAFENKKESSYEVKP